MLTSLRIASITAGLLALAAPLGAQGSDDCAGAEAIQGHGVFAFDNGAATADGVADCGMGRDVWFRWTAPATEQVELSTCGLTALDTALGVFAAPAAGQCPGAQATALACNDDDPGCGPQSSVNFAAVAGEEYLLRVGSWAFAPGGAGQFRLGPSTFVPGCVDPAVGPDVIAGDIEGVAVWGTEGGVTAYSFSTTACNVGDQELDWFMDSGRHPALAHNLYRLEDGRLDPIGMSWAKHGFAAVQFSLCCNCIPSGTSSRLGVGCSDPYSAGTNGIQAGLAPRGEMDAATGALAWPIGSQVSVPMPTGLLDRRLQARAEDLDPALHPGARYFVEAVYVAPDDAAAGNAANNVSFREFAVTTPTGEGWRLAPVGVTERGVPASVAWAASRPTARLDRVRVPGEGLLWVASDATLVAPGAYLYEYAVFNLSSHRGVRGLEVPAGAAAGQQDQRFALAHSGDPRSNAPWAASIARGRAVWETASAAADPLANAILWGSAHAFSFRSSTPPTEGAATLRLFRPGAGPAELLVPARVPGGPAAASYCDAEPNSGGTVGRLVAGAHDAAGRTLELIATGLPPGAIGMVVTSRDEAFVPMAGGSAGNLCLGGSIGRSVGAFTAQADGGGAFRVTADLDALPQPAGFATAVPGETWRFQAWHRDGPTSSNFTTGLRARL